jgi:hypothetical protein
MRMSLLLSPRRIHERLSHLTTRRAALDVGARE